MVDDSHDPAEQAWLPVPESFLALYTSSGRAGGRTNARAIAARHDWCEDLAQMLVDTAREQYWSLGISEGDVLERIGQGLAQTDPPLSGAEARWVIRRLAELLVWPDPGPEASVQAPHAD